jgi:hypothetical protein
MSFFGFGFPSQAKPPAASSVAKPLHESHEVFLNAQRMLVHAQIDQQMHATQTIYEALFFPVKFWVPLFVLPRKA